MRHVSKVREAANRTISQPGNTPATSPPAKSKVDLITPGHNSSLTGTGRKPTSR
jgi:hypothetical protein